MQSTRNRSGNDWLKYLRRLTALPTDPFDAGMHARINSTPEQLYDSATSVLAAQVWHGPHGGNICRWPRLWSHVDLASVLSHVSRQAGVHGADHICMHVLLVLFFSAHYLYLLSSIDMQMLLASEQAQSTRTISSNFYCMHTKYNLI